MHECPKCGKQTDGTLEDGTEWAVCADCMHKENMQREKRGRGRPKNGKKLVQINTRVTPEVDARLREMANQEGRSLSNLIAWILIQAVKAAPSQGQEETAPF